MTEIERWAAYARVILEKVSVNGEPALDFIDRVMIALPASSGERCLECGGLDGAHGRVHTRYGNGGGGNLPCSRAQESGDPS